MVMQVAASNTWYGWQAPDGQPTESSVISFGKLGKSAAKRQKQADLTYDTVQIP